jgi:hypothetical protein
MSNQNGTISMEYVTDAGELAKTQGQRERFNRNAAWLQAHIPEVYSQYRGKCICVAGEELFVADSAKEAIALATTAHPDDEGWFTRYIPKERAARIYADQW